MPKTPEGQFAQDCTYFVPWMIQFAQKEQIGWNLDNLVQACWH